MLFISGENGKGRLAEIIKLYNNDCLIISIGGPNLQFANYIVDHSLNKFNEYEFNDELKNFIINNVSGNCKYIILYTNIHGYQARHYIEGLQEIEKKLEGIIQNCIIMYKQ